MIIKRILVLARAFNLDFGGVGIASILRSSIGKILRFLKYESVQRKRLSSV